MQASRAHAAANSLVGRFKNFGVDKSRSEILQNISEATVRSGCYVYPLLDKKCIHPGYGKGFQFQQYYYVLEVALLTATVMRFTSALEHILNPTRYCKKDMEEYFASPLQCAISWDPTSGTTIFQDWSYAP